MSYSSPEGIILGKGSELVSLDLSINKEKVSSFSPLGMTCKCMRPSPGDFTANCRSCGLRIEDSFNQSLDTFKQAPESKHPEHSECGCGHNTCCNSETETNQEH